MASRFDARRFDEAWRRYVVQATKAHSGFMSHLHRGAAPEQIATAEHAIGSSFPPDLRHLLAKHDGSDDVSVLPGWSLYSAHRIVREWMIWDDLRRKEFKPENLGCEPIGPVRGDEWWRRDWIPFCGDGGGNHLCVDMDPAFGGTVGQVITMWHDDPRRELIAYSLTDFVELIASDFAQGKLIWDDEWGGVYATPE